VKKCGSRNWSWVVKNFSKKYKIFIRLARTRIYYILDKTILVVYQNLQIIKQLVVYSYHGDNCDGTNCTMVPTVFNPNGLGKISERLFFAFFTPIFFTPKFLIFLHQFFSTPKFLIFFAPKFLLFFTPIFLHQKFSFFYTKNFAFFTSIFFQFLLDPIDYRLR